MLPPAQLILFGDQAVPCRDELQRLLARKDSPLLVMLLADGHRALAREMVGLPSDVQPSVARHASLEEMLEADRVTPAASCALDSALVCLSQIASFVSYLLDTGAEYPQPSRAVIVGRCIGLLAATAVSCSGSIADLVALAPEMVALAFRTGLLVQRRTTAVTLRASSIGLSVSCSVIVGNTEADVVQKLLDVYGQSEGVPATAKLYVSAVGHDSVTVSGPPEHLERFRARNSNLRTAPVMVHGLFHAAHLYTDNESQTLAQGLRSRPACLRVLSNADGLPIPATTSADLVSVALKDILTQPMQWTRMVEQAACLLEGHNETVVLPFAAGSSAHAFTKMAGFRVAETATQAPPSTRSKIAIIGFSGRYPESDSNEEYWELLMAGRDVHKEVPRERFDPNLYYDAAGKRKNTSAVRHGCFLKNAAQFDARFFGLSPREAEQADPAQRLALMTAYEAMEMAGLVPDATPSTQRDRVGVFYGTASDDYRECNSGQDIDTYFVPGGSRAFLPARINYQWRFSGPSLDVDTACSSSLAALHMACNCLWRGDCDTALAGGTNVLTNPDNWAGLDRAHFLSHTGNCRTFDDGADGYCRSESVSTLVLKRLDDALCDGDPVFGTILGAFTNHSAEAVSMTRPHSGAQRAIFSRVLTSAGVDRADVSYVEMHGTGTQAGDACEMDAVLSVFAPDNNCNSSTTPARTRPLYLGSAKANIGHAESASGAASLIKVLLMMRHEQIPPNIGITTRINRNFPTDLAQRNIHIARQATLWKRPAHQVAPYGRRAFVNNFGAAGGNSCVLLEDAPLPEDTGNSSPDPRPVHLVAVSARTKTALQRNIRALRTHLVTTDVSLSALSYTTTARRMQHAFRVIVAGSSLQEIRGALTTAENRTISVTSTNGTAPSIGFCFTGQGCQYAGMGRELLSMPPFRAILERLEGLVRLNGFPSVLDVLNGSMSAQWDNLTPVQTQLAQTCLQMALTQYWRNLGVVPRLVVGHSLGDYAAMNAAGMLSDAETLYLVGTRAQLLQDHCTTGTHAMLAVRESRDQVAAALRVLPHLRLEIACVNGPQDTIVAGPMADVQVLAQWLVRQQSPVKTTQLAVPFAFHSAQVEPMLDAFRESCRSIAFQEPKVAFLSPLLGRVIRSLSDLCPDAADPAVYLTRHCREAVAFSPVLSLVDEAKNLCWVEIGPHPVCSGMLRNTLGTSVRVLPSLRRNESDWKTVTATLATLYESGLSIRWAEFHRGFGRWPVLPLPAYQWDLKEYWIPYRHDWCLTKGDAPVVAAAPVAMPINVLKVPEKPLTAAVQMIVHESHGRDTSSVKACSNVQHPPLKAVLLGHRINGRPMCPSSAFANMALTLFNQLLVKSSLPNPSLLGISVDNMVVDKALLLDENTSTQWIELRATADWASRTASFTLASISADGQHTTTHHAQCTGTFAPKSAWQSVWKRQGFLVASRMEQLQRAALYDEDEGVGSGSDHDGEVQLLRPSLFYKLFGSIVHYGSSFRGLRELIMRSAGLECTARIRFNTPSDETDSWGGCSPYWIESLGQITGFSLNGNDTLDNENNVFINHGWGSMRLVTPLSPTMTYRTYVKMHEDQGSYTGDLYIFKPSGEIIGMYEGVIFNKLRRSVFDRLIPKAGAPVQTTQTTQQVETPLQTKTPQELQPQTVPAAPLPVPERAPVVAAQTSSSAPNIINNTQDDTETVARVRALISDEVGVSSAEMSDDDNLADMGVDSLLALTMADRINEDFGVTVPSSAFIAPLTVRGLIRLVIGDNITSTPPASSDQETDSSTSPAPSVSSGPSSVADASSLDVSSIDIPKLPPLPAASSVLLQGSPQTASKTLWLVPDGSGLATSYLSLPDVDRASVAVYALNSPFLKNRGGPQELCMSQRTFVELTGAYLTELRRRQPHGPYILGGWSAGGICAYHMAQELVNAGETVSRLILLDSPNPIGLAKLPARLYDEFTQLGIFGSDTAETGQQRSLPSWLLPHFMGFVDILHTYTPTPFVGPNPLSTWVIWAQDGVDDAGSIAIHPEDPPNLHWLLRRRTDAVLGANGWDALVGKENIHTEVVQEANHFTLLKEPAAGRVGSFLARAMGVGSPV